MANEQNLKPYAAGDGRTAERRKGGLTSGYKRLQKGAQADLFYYLLLDGDIKAFIRQNQNKPFGKKRKARLKELTHRKRILENRLRKHGGKIQQRKEELKRLYNIDV